MVCGVLGDPQMNDALDLSEGSTNSFVATPEASQGDRAVPTTSSRVVKLLQRGKGATLSELQESTGWQPHSVRAFLSGLRQKGEVLVKEQRKSGDTAYRLAVGKVAGAPADA